MKYKSKSDWSYNMLMIFMGIITLYVLVSAFIQQSSNLFISGTIILIMDVVFILPIYFLTYYEIAGDTLIIKNGLVFKKKIKIDNIVGIAPAHNPVSSKVLSANRIAVFYDMGKRVRTEYISPANKQEFISELIKLNSDIMVKI